MEKGYLVKTEAFDVYENMACDEILCETMPVKYILRFFNWKDNGITFGFSQKYANVIKTLDEKYKIWKITRRPTGGGIVIHENDLTFSFIFHSPEDFNPGLTYDKLHSAIMNEYLLKGIKLEIVNKITNNYNINNPVMDCFKKPVEKDLLVNGKKVLGGALRKFSDYMLYQASLQFDDARIKFDFHSDIIISSLKKLFNLSFEEYYLNDNYYQKIKTKTEEKYKNENWIKRI